MPYRIVYNNLIKFFIFFIIFEDSQSARPIMLSLLWICCGLVVKLVLNLSQQIHDISPSVRTSFYNNLYNRSTADAQQIDVMEFEHTVFVPAEWPAV